MSIIHSSAASLTMSHLLCPLCGKYAPLSTLDPDRLDLDLRVVSFVGLGRGRGFSKTDEHSILGDGEHSPRIARRVAELCRMFLEAGELGGGPDRCAWPGFACTCT